ncbi:uncharacterized protein LOC127850355 [Dreissena polymorpha]|uniref:uncharacterized protein LOC127850355 n=1 Tax=Dreissena polymorpha TaxID=45954 RepID=UPI0022641DE3|nr:uncharacterized protein LOC127850355 [Dreissena polymorpha]XP_052239290.1 uncharacterized protein LOC127850355 [Dreissena polymorpha]
MATEEGKAVVFREYNGRGVFYGRNRSAASVSDDDLFGPDMAMQLLEQPSTNQSDMYGSDQSFEIEDPQPQASEHALIPNFSLIVGDSDSLKDASMKKILSDSSASGDPFSGDELSNETLFSLFNRKPPQRSVSSETRREVFRKSRDLFAEDIPEPDQMVPVPFRKSNSMPDLSNSLPDLVITSLPGAVTHSTDLNQEPALYSVKRNFEGPSCNKPRQLRRSVSIQETPEECIFNEDDCPSELRRRQGRLSGTGEETSPTGSTTENRNPLVSKSSGYHSQQSGSQESEFSRSSSGVWRSCDSTEGEKGGADTDLGLTAHNTGQEQRQVTTADLGAQIAPDKVEHTHVDSVAEGCKLAAMLPCSALLSDASSQTLSGTAGDLQSYATNSDQSFQTVISFKTHLVSRLNVRSEVANEQSENNGLPFLSLLDNSSISVEDLNENEKLTAKQPNSLPSVTMTTDSKWVCEPAGSSSDEYDKQAGDDASFSITANIGCVEEEDARHLERVQRDHLTPGQDHLTPGGLSAVSQHSSSGSSASPMSSGAINYKQNSEEFRENIFNTRILELSPNMSESQFESLRKLWSYRMPSNRANGELPLHQKDMVFSQTDLERASWCGQPQCEDSSCRMMTKIQLVISCDHPSLHVYFPFVKDYCGLLWQHAEGCDEIKCRVMYCKGIWQLSAESNEVPTNQIVSWIKEQMSRPVLQFLHDKEFTFHRLCADSLVKEPRQFETHVPLYALGRFGTAVVCLETDRDRLCLMKTNPPMDYSHHVSLYKCLKGQTDRHLIRHYWMLEYDTLTQVCTEFLQGGSLQELLLGKRRLSWELAAFYLTQILQGVTFLHSNNIVYLNWQSKNMVFTDSRCKCVKVSNLGLSCPLNGQTTDCQIDIGAVKQCLAPHLAPPELIRNNAVCLESDSWGAGLLLYEMVTGSPMLDKHRHLGRDKVHNSVLKNCQKGFSRELQGLQEGPAHVIRGCWKEVPAERPSLETLLEQFRLVGRVH